MPYPYNNRKPRKTETKPRKRSPEFDDKLFSLAITLLRDAGYIYTDGLPFGWNIYAVNHKQGMCYYCKKYITIPVWAIEDDKKKKGYLKWYVAHELAHMISLLEYKKNDNHGPLFMKCLKEICPEEYQHYEFGYKPRNAAAAGVSRKGMRK